MPTDVTETQPIPSGRDTKSVTPTVGEVTDVPFWKSKQILSAVSGLAGGLIAVCHGFHIPLPISEGDLALGLGGVFATLASGYFMFRRIKAGIDPANPTPRISVRTGNQP